jgi:hypothetical protein
MCYPVYVYDLPARLQRDIAYDLLAQGFDMINVESAMSSKIDDMSYALTRPVRKRVKMFLEGKWSA